MRLMHSNSVQRYSFLGSNEVDWIEIAKEFIVNNDNNVLIKLIEFMYSSLLDRYRDESYFRTIVYWNP